MKYIFVDFEMHPIDRKYQEERAICQCEIIEFGAVVLDEDYCEISSFKEYVKPQYTKEVCTRISVLTKITASMLDNARKFADVFECFLDWCESFRDEYVIYAWSENDLNQIRKEAQLKRMVWNKKGYKLIENWIDFQKDYCELVKAESPLSLEKALNLVGQCFLGERHDALCDARNMADLFMVTRDTKEVRRLLRLIKGACDDKIVRSSFLLGEIFDFTTFQLA